MTRPDCSPDSLVGQPVLCGHGVLKQDQGPTPGSTLSSLAPLSQLLGGCEPPPLHTDAGILPTLYGFCEE